MPQFTIDINDHCSSPVVDHAFLECVICRVLVEQEIDVATISLALVSDEQIHDLNRQFLGHDYPTDVISFRLDEPSATEGQSHISLSDADKNSFDGADAENSFEAVSQRTATGLLGELVVSYETATREASLHGWTPQAELLLYVVHGLLHLCGYDDLTDEARPVMRSRERELLAIWGFCPTGLEP